MRKYIYLVFSLVFALGLFCSCKEKTFTVTINYEDGTSSLIENIKKGSKVEEPYKNLPTGVESIQYFNEKNEKFSFDTQINSDLIITAKFVLKEYTINFYNYDNSIIESIILPYGSDVIFPETPTREGGEGYSYEFKDWTIKTTTVTQNLNYTARFTKVYDEMTVTLLDFDGSILEIEKCDYNSYINTYNEPEFDKNPNKFYRFLGWYEKDTEILFDFEKEIKRNYTIYPKYEVYDYEDVKLENATISFVGDSISTFYSTSSQVNSLYGGTNQFYYPLYSATVKTVEKTWWYQTYTQLGLKLGVNNSWSGSAAYGHGESAGMSESRLKTLDDNGTPNIVIIFLGTNDNVNGHTVENVKEAYKKMIEYISTNCIDFSNNTAKVPYIYLFTNGYTAYNGYYYTEEKRLEYNNLFKELTKQYDNVRLFDLATHINKNNYSACLGDNLHYNADGMNLIATKLVEQLRNDFNSSKQLRNVNCLNKIVYFKKEQND